MPHYRFIHLSDIHFGQERPGDQAIHEDVRVELLRDCERLFDTYGAADGILVSGDVAYSGKPEQYKIAGEWLDTLTSMVHCPATSVYLVPGNHDIDVSKIGTMGKLLHTQLRVVPLDQLDGLLGSLDHDHEVPNLLLPKLSAYREFAERYGCDFASPGHPVWTKDLHMHATNKLSFVGMTSVMVSDLSDSINAMVLGNQQYIVNRSNCTELVVMIHHPLSWFRDHEKVENYLQRALIVFSGHEHNLKVQRIEHSAGQTLWIQAGATNSQEGQDPYQYRYNWIEFVHNMENNSHSLQVKIQPRVWDAARTKFNLDGMLLQGQEFLTYDLPCPEFQMPVQNSEVNPVIIENSTQGQNAVEDVREIMNQDPNSFIRLRYLFWKHLGWRDRLNVLVELDILPSDLDQPMPQTLERLALENAFKAGKLRPLWDAIMNRIPEDQRESNPF